MKTTPIKLINPGYEKPVGIEVESVKLSFSLGSFTVFMLSGGEIQLQRNNHSFYLHPDLIGLDMSNRNTDLDSSVQKLLFKDGSQGEATNLQFDKGLYVIDGGMASGKSTLMKLIVEDLSLTNNISVGSTVISNNKSFESSISFIKSGEPDVTDLLIGNAVQRILPFDDEAASIYALAQSFLDPNVSTIFIDSLKLQLYNTSGAAMSKGMKPLFMSDLTALSALALKLNKTIIATLNSLDVTTLQDVSDYGTDVFYKSPYYFSLGGSVTGVLILNKLFEDDREIYCSLRNRSREPFKLSREHLNDNLYFYKATKSNNDNDSLNSNSFSKNIF